MLGRVLLVACLAALCGLTGADIQFPASCHRTNATTTQRQLPLNFLLRFSDVEDFDEFFNYLDEDSRQSDIIATTINSRFGEGPAVPKNAVCIPEMQVVELITKKDSSMLYFPTCTRLEQCGGCCNSDLLKCQPTKTHTVNYTVYTTQYVGGDRVSVRNKQVVSVEKHLECQCSCAIKREHCNERQVYEEDNCSCRCLNSADEESCRADNDTKIWDAKLCQCLCRRTLSCSSGYVFDNNTCSCEMEEAQQRRRSVASVRATQRRSRSLPVMPLNTAARMRPAAP